jgi:hypothetical protein
MRKPTIRLSKTIVAACLIPLTLPLLSVLQAQSDAPLNLARWHRGASLILVNEGQFQRIKISEVQKFTESVLLSDNSALTYEISKGPHDYIIDLGASIRISRFFFNNESAEGTLQLMSANFLAPLESGEWVKLTKPIAFIEGVLPSVNFIEIETRYLLIRFNIETSGRIGHLGTTGPTKQTATDPNSK